MSALVGVVEGAINFCSGSVGGFSDSVGSFFGRVVKDWTLWAVSALGVAGVATGIAGAIFLSPVLIAVSVGVFAIALFLGIYQMVKNAPEKELEGVVQDLSKANKEMGVALIEFDKNVLQLKSERNALQLVLEESRATVAELESTLSKKSEQMDAVSKELQDAVEKLSLLESAQKELADTELKIAKDVSSFAENLVEMKQANHMLSAETAKVELQEETLSYQVQKLETLTKAHQAQNLETQGLTDGMQEVTASLKGDLSHMDENLKTLGIQTEVLASAGKTFQQQTEKLEALASKAEKLFSQIDDFGEVPAPVLGADFFLEIASPYTPKMDSTNPEILVF